MEQIYQDRDQFAKLVRVAAPDVGRMGIEILSFTIKVQCGGKTVAPVSIRVGWGACQEGPFMPLTIPRDDFPSLPRRKTKWTT